MTQTTNQNTTKRIPQARRKRPAGPYPADSLVGRVGARIRALREQQGLTLRAFGERAQVHPFHVMAIELGQLAANSETLRAIAVGLGVTSADLLNHGAEPDDLGGIVELLRQQPALVPIALARVKVMSRRKLGVVAPTRARRGQPAKAMASQGANA